MCKLVCVFVVLRSARYNIVIGEDMYIIYVLQQVRRDFSPCHLIHHMFVFPRRVKHHCCFIGYKGSNTSWYLNGFPDGSNFGSTV